MQIQQSGKYGYQFNDNLVSFGLNLEKADESLKLVIDTKNLLKTGDIKRVSVNGEYEYSDITILMYKLDEKFKNEINYALISNEGINILWLSEEVKELSKEDIENLPQIHLLILKLNPDTKVIEKQVDLVPEIEPYYLCIDVESKDLLKVFEKEYGETAEEIKKLKIKSDEFGASEEVATKFINLI